ncbi:MAG: hypothetical protein ACIAXF_00160 [Phycisphaerales bacterium JB063]
MKQFEVDSSYRQFYIADAELEPEAPEEWTEAHVAQRHNTHQYIAALCPEGDDSASIISVGPNEERPSFDETVGFEVETKIEVPSGRVGVYGWPWELQDEYQVKPGRVLVRFVGYSIDQVDAGKDFYLVQICAE